LKHTYKALTLTLALSLFTAGCTQNPAMTAFHEEMKGFYESLFAVTSSLNAIDPVSETAASELLVQVDQMEALFQTLAAIEVPDDFEDQFGNIEELADEAAEYMVEASDLYHEVYEDEGIDESVLMTADEYYSRAMKRVNYIAQYLQGHVPEGSNITVIENTDEPDWTGGDLPAQE